MPLPTSPLTGSKPATARAETTVNSICKAYHITSNELRERFGASACENVAFVRAVLAFLIKTSLPIGECHKLIQLEADRRRNGRSSHKGVPRSKPFIRRDCEAALENFRRGVGRENTPNLLNIPGQRDIDDMDENGSIISISSFNEQIEENPNTSTNSPSSATTSSKPIDERLSSPYLLQNQLMISQSNNLFDHDPIHASQSTVSRKAFCCELSQCSDLFWKLKDEYSTSMQGSRNAYVRYVEKHKQRLETSNTLVAQETELETLLSESLEAENDVLVLAEGSDRQLKMNRRISSSALLSKNQALVDAVKELQSAAEKRSKITQDQVKAKRAQKAEMEKRKYDLDQELAMEDTDIPRRRESDKMHTGHMRALHGLMTTILHDLEENIKLHEDFLSTSADEMI